MLDNALFLLGLNVAGQVVNTFTPASLFPATGAWYDPSDISTLFQDSAGTTPVTTTGQPVGKMLDKSGNGNHFTQATTTQRPIYTVAGGLAFLQFDGVDDFLATAVATLPASADVSTAVFNAANATQFLLVSNAQSGPGFIGVTSVGDPGASSGTFGAPTNQVNGAAVNPDTRDGLYTALGSTAPKVFESLGGDMASLPWTGLSIGNYSNNAFAFSGRFFGLVIAPAQSAATRAQLRTYLGGKCGVAL